MKRHLFCFFFILFISIGSMTVVSFLFGAKEPTSGVQKDFTGYLDQLFEDWVSADSITLHYRLSAPEKYGIHASAPSLSGSYFSDADDYENELKKLHSFSSSSLNRKQKKLYHILEDYLTRQKNLAQFPLYQTVFSPTTGLQAQLPVTLCEYPLRTEEDILTYFALLEQIPDYFHQLFEQEEKKSAQGLFVCDRILDQIISQMNAFLKEKEKTPLITTFDERISSLSLSPKQKKSYAARNQSLILHTVLPAYRTLMQNLLSLKGTGTNDLGLCYYDRGKEYYAALTAALTGSDRSPAQMIQMTEDNISDCYDELEEILYLHPASYDRFLDTDLSELVPSTEKDILSWLRNHLSKDFPTPANVSFQVKTVPSCLEAYVSPAFYMIPSIDSFHDNTIYLNQFSLSSLTSPYSVLAHEGYPGHLYQITYFYSHLDHPIHTLCDYNGYVEGWATYAENLSYTFLDYGKDSAIIARLFQINHILNLAIPSRIDLGVHYEGWNKRNVTKFLSHLGLEKEEVSEDIFDSILAEPGNYLSYYIGFLEILSIKQHYDNIAKETNNYEDFYCSFLTNGPCNFSYFTNFPTNQD